MKILITGANGFIGSYLADYLIGKGHDIIATSRQFHASTLELLQKASILELDVLDKEKMDKLDIMADVIVHTATANDSISKDTLKGIELSAVGTKNILDLAVRNRIPACMVFSTFQVYGTELMGEIDESSSLHCQNDYGLNHLYAELYAEMYSRTGKVRCVSVRPSNVYGNILTDAFNRWNLVPGCFCREASTSRTITIKSSGKQMRNFVNLENLSRAAEAVLEHFPVSYECYNFASSQGYTMQEVAGMVKKVYEKKYGKSLVLNITGDQPADTNFFNVKLDKLHRLGFTEDENFNLESAIEQIFNYSKLT
jgi:UDP-glucose 4-epimerase